MKPSAWIVDDDDSIRWVLEKALGREGIAWRSFIGVQAAQDALIEAKAACALPGILLSDIRMPGEDGLHLLAHVKTQYPGLPVIIMTAHGDLENAVSAFAGGAFEYLTKPFDIDQALTLIRRALAEPSSTNHENGDALAGNEMLGSAPAMQEVFRAIGRLAPSHANVLITGESGSGKELVARALHRHSPRKNGPFVAINTAAIPADLLESELFGHEKGAFTGAQNERRGRFEQAEGGTLFLDEIGDMPPSMQTRLLRVLSDGHYYRVGGHTLRTANVRLLAATHQNLEERVKNGLFREDLFHRLNVIRLRLPPLRERREDIELLARSFLGKSARELGIEPKRLSNHALDYLKTLPFPGNVRQLENLCHWLTVMAPGQQIERDDLPPDIGNDNNPASVDLAPPWEKALAGEIDRLLIRGVDRPHDKLLGTFEGILIQRALAHSGGRRAEAAQALGIGRNTLTRKIQELNLDNNDDHRENSDDPLHPPSSILKPGN